MSFPLATDTLSDQISGRVIAQAAASMNVMNSKMFRVPPVSTNAEGLYVAPNLIPGTYEANIGATSFAPAFFQNGVPTIGERHEINARIAVGQASSNITVSTGEVVDQQLASSAISGVVESHTVVGLPLNGRDWTSLELLQPGVAQVRTQSALAISHQRANRGLGTDVANGGNLLQQNNFRLDGVSIKEQQGSSDLLHLIII